MLKSIRQALLLGGLVPLLIALPASAQVPATLTGETLEGNVTTTSDCASVGINNFTMNFSGGGVAGPTYPGTFTESGVYHAQTQELNATFEIFSGDTLITGTKFGPPVAGTPSGRVCFFGLGGFGGAYNYEAKIQTPTGTFADRGTALTEVSASGLLTETFTSSLAAAAACKDKPGSDKCKKGQDK